MKRSNSCENLHSHWHKEPATKIRDSQEMTETSKYSRTTLEIKRNYKTADKTGQTGQEINKQQAINLVSLNTAEKKKAKEIATKIFIQKMHIEKTTDWLGAVIKIKVSFSSRN